MNSQKRWELGDWNIPIKICYEALKGSIAEYTLKTGTEIGDLTSTEFMTYIIRPALEKQMMRRKSSLQPVMVCLRESLLNVPLMLSKLQPLPPMLKQRSLNRNLLC